MGSPNGPRSSVWHFWSRKSEVYAQHGRMGGIEKFSFHTPSLCLHAFTTEHGRPKSMASRANQAWHRDETPPAGLNRAVRVLRIGISTDVLSTKLELTTSKPVMWVPPAPPGGTTVIDLMFVRDGARAVRESLQSEPVEMQHTLLAYKQLPNGEAFAVTSHHAKNGDGPLRVPASHGQKHDLIIYPDDPFSSGRPVRMTTFSKPKDGDIMLVWEWGAFWHPPLTDSQWSEWVEAVKIKEAT